MVQDINNIIICEKSIVIMITKNEIVAIFIKSSRVEDSTKFFEVETVGWKRYEHRDLKVGYDNKNIFGYCWVEDGRYDTESSVEKCYDGISLGELREDIMEGENFFLSLHSDLESPVFLIKNDGKQDYKIFESAKEPQDLFPDIMLF